MFQPNERTKVFSLIKNKRAIIASKATYRREHQAETHNREEAIPHIPLTQPPINPTSPTSPQLPRLQPQQVKHPPYQHSHYPTTPIKSPLLNF